MRGAGVVRSVVLFLFAHTPSQAQTPSRLEFEVASVRPKHEVVEGNVYRPGISISGARVTLSGPVQFLVMDAYDTKEYQVLGAPAWTDSYEITAKATGERAPSREQAREMLQALLAERFQLRNFPSIDSSLQRAARS